MRGRPLKFQSKLEQQAYNIITSILEKLNAKFDVYLHYYFPDLQISVDIAIPQLLLAFEIQGEQHRQKEHFFNKMQVNRFDRQQNRDMYLKEMLELNGWRLIELYEEDLTEEKIKAKIFEE